jgi:hypothetical protein
MSDEWYVYRAGQQYGPYAWQEIIVYARDGNIAGEDLLWSQSTVDWLRADEIPGLFPAAPVASPSAPPRKRKVGLIVGGSLLALLLVILSLWFFGQDRAPRIAPRDDDEAQPAVAYLPGEPAPLNTTPETQSATSSDGRAITLTLDDGTSVAIPDLPGGYEVTLERAGNDLPVTSSLQEMTALRATGALRRLTVRGETDPSALKPIITIPVYEAGSVDLDTLNVLRVGDVLVDGELVRDYAIMLPVSLDDDGNLRFVDPLMPDGILSDQATRLPSDGGNPYAQLSPVRSGLWGADQPRYAARVAAQPLQTDQAQQKQWEWMGSAYYVLMTFQEDLNWSRPPQLVRMIPDATRPESGYRRPTTPSERAELAKKPLCNVLILVHGHNEEEKEGSYRFTAPEPWMFSYKQLVWDLLYREIMVKERQQPLYPYECTAFYEFIYPTYRPIFSPVSEKTGALIPTLGESLGRLVKEELQSDPQIKAMQAQNMPFNVILVSHSQGGLVARAGFHHMPEAFKGRIVRFISWGSPHHGAALYTLRYAFQAGHDLVLDGVRLPLQNIRNSAIMGPILVGQLNANVALDTPGIRDLRWDASKKDMLDIRALFPSISDDATEARIQPALYSENLSIFNKTLTAETWGMKSPPYTLIYGVTSKTAALEMVDVRGGWWLQYRTQQVRRFAESTSIQQGAALNAMAMKAAHSSNDGAVPVYSQKAEGVSIYTVVSMGDVDHEEFYGAEPGQRRDATIYLGSLTAQKTFDEADLGHPSRSCPTIEYELEQDGDDTVITGQVVFSLYDPRHGGDGKVGQRIERIEARGGAPAGALIKDLAFTHADDGSYRGVGKTARLSEGPITLVAVLKDKSQVTVAAEITWETPIVVFEDPNLDAAIRYNKDYTGHSSGPIYLRDVIGIKELYPAHQGIKSIEGLQHLRYLESLSLQGNEVTDISPLKALTGLTGLRLDGNYELRDISALQNLTRLENLFLDMTKLSDISVLENLVNLRRLEFDINQVSDISALRNLTDLEFLSFERNQVSDISALANLTRLRLLDISENEVSDISALQNLTSLERLRIRGNRVTDISALVSNRGLGSGDNIFVERNSLDTSPGSKAMQDIQSLIDRGVAANNYRDQRKP